MKMLRNAAVVIATGTLLSACVPPTTSFRVSSTAVGDTPRKSVTINAGETAVLHWSQQTNMPGTSGQTVTRDYSIIPGDPRLASISIPETCTANALSTDWPCVKTPRAGTVNVAPYASTDYVLEGRERLYTSLNGVPIPFGNEAIQRQTVTVTVNQDVAISSVLPFVTDAALNACISAAATTAGATMTSQLVDLSCSGLGIERLQGLAYFYNLSTVDLSNNAVKTATGEPNGLMYLTNAMSVNLQQSGITCVRQKQIAEALPAATVLTGQGGAVPCN